MKQITPLIVLFALCLFSACSKNEYRVRVRATAFSSPAAAAHYFLLPGDKTIRMNNPEFREFAGYVKAVLAERQYIEAGAVDAADVVIFLSYGLRLPFGSPDAFLSAGDGMGRMIPFSLSYGSSGGDLGTGGSAYVRRSGIPIPFTTARNVYRRYLTMEAVDGPVYTREGTRMILWKITATSVGYSTDLAKIFPVMLSVCKPFIGETTKNEVTVDISENDKQGKRQR